MQEAPSCRQNEQQDFHRPFIDKLRWLDALHLLGGGEMSSGGGEKHVFPISLSLPSPQIANQPPPFTQTQTKKFSVGEIHFGLTFVYNP